MAKTNTVCKEIPKPEKGMDAELDKVRVCCPETYIWMRRVRAVDKMR